MEHNLIMVNGYPALCPANGKPFPSLLEYAENKEDDTWFYWSSPVYGGGSVGFPDGDVIGIHDTLIRKCNVKCKHCGIKTEL